jgi:hypothetical protein
VPEGALRRRGENIYINGITGDWRRLPNAKLHIISGVIKSKKA